MCSLTGLKLINLIQKSQIMQISQKSLNLLFSFSSLIPCTFIAAPHPKRGVKALELSSILTYQLVLFDALRCYILSNLMIILRSIAYIFGLLLFTISHNCLRWIMTKLWHLPKPVVFLLLSFSLLAFLYSQDNVVIFRWWEFK